MSDGTTPKAVLFDIDGTLVDSNYLHIDAWDRAFADVGHPVDVWRIHRSIGMDSGVLLQTLLGADADRLGDEAKQRHSDYYAGTMSRLRSFEGAQPLLRELAARGYAVVLATSAPPDELEVLRDVLGIEDAVTEITSSADVETAKPDPDIVRVALDKAGVAPDEAVMVGDSVWDVAAAVRAGVRSIGFRSGGFSAGELLHAGAVEVFDDSAQLLRRLPFSQVFRVT